MSSITNGSDGDGGGDTETSPDAGPKTNHNLSIVYIDHNLDKSIDEPTYDDTAENTSHPNLTVVYIDHHLDGSISSDTGAVIQNQQGLFRLPPELRIIIWELLLPGERILRARARFGRDRRNPLDNGSSKTKKRRGTWHFRVYKWEIGDYEGHFLRLPIPTVLEICRESRQVALRHGSFIFGQRDNVREAGTWWNPDLDVLAFDHSWDLDQHPWALEELYGLEHVKNIAIDEQLAWTFRYNAGYNGSDPLDIPRELREPLAVTFEFRESDDRHHFILEFFPHFQHLSILFSTLHWMKYHERLILNMDVFDEDFILEEDACSVTFRLGSDMKTAVKELRKCRELCMKKTAHEPDFRNFQALVDGPVYSVKDDDVDVDHLEYWMGAGFGMCRLDQDVPI
ncbi:hypothetical protein INS49_015066 [Diaporthe citri]|uniref:uncharacterized protein n=1 Tax=Diaporthe citri TaxID=83186 RepID=UPI001C81D835|nr:uncharacterized protein INS49_015066 [Diaporthe citri]KAG6357188.1 hypothetical protein INS49_015066 [Diaporthe citri]